MFAPELPFVYEGHHSRPIRGRRPQRKTCTARVQYVCTCVCVCHVRYRVGHTHTIKQFEKCYFKPVSKTAFWTKLLSLKNLEIYIYIYLSVGPGKFGEKVKNNFLK